MQCSDWYTAGYFDLMHILRDFEEHVILTVLREAIKACSHSSAVTCGDPDSLSGQSDRINHQCGALESWAPHTLQLPTALPVKQPLLYVQACISAVFHE